MSLTLIKRNFPEVVFSFLALCLVYEKEKINFLFLGIFILLIILLFTQNRILGAIIGILAILSSLFMLLAVFSEFREFPSINKESLLLLLFGSAIFITTLISGFYLLKKYLAFTPVCTTK